jgi:hypothetical protein
MRIRKVDADSPKSMSARLRELRENQDRTFFFQFGFQVESEVDIRAGGSETALDQRAEEPLPSFLGAAQ